VILTVTPNPALDLTYGISPLELGESNRVPAALVRAGGKGVSVARVAVQAGLPAEIVTTVGGDTGEEFSRSLASSGLRAHLVEVPATASSPPEVPRAPRAHPSPPGGRGA
jgi:fructose-1-phosphate kinase PfkB-like protein